MELTKGRELENKGLSVNVKLTETEIFKDFLKEYSSILEDERIEKSIREEYYSRLEIIMKENINR